MTGRECALKALYEIQINGAYCDKALKKILANNDIIPAEKSLATVLVYGVTDKKRRLDYIIQHYSKQKLKKISPFIINILRMGVYQILFLDKIPDSAAVNESVKLARRYGHNASAGFVNGVLRSVAREGDVSYSDDDFGIFYSVPDWLTELLTSQYGTENVKKIYEAFSIPSPTTVRVNTLKCNAKDLEDALKNNGIIVNKTKFENMLQISNFGDISNLKQYKDGLFTPQDLSSYFAALMVDAKNGEKIIDLCAAPGGKTTQMAENSKNGAEITAFDLYQHKVDIIVNNCKRLGISCVKQEVFDSTIINENYLGYADKVLADVPCSGLGVIGKKFDIKWTRTPADISKIIEIQKRILLNASKYLKNHGVLVYSTCTINRNENEEVIKWFLKDNKFSIVEEKTILPYDGGDGFYICKLTKE